MTFRISRLPLSKKDQSIVDKAVKITKFKGFKAGWILSKNCKKN
jgi:hypothetical protein